MPNSSQRTTQPARVSRLDVVRHAKTLLRPRLLRNWYRQYFPVEVQFLDRQVRQTRRSVRRLYQYWQKSEGSTREMVEAYSVYPGGDMLDIGASNGFYSLLLGPKANRGARFLSIEPFPREQQALLENLGEAKRLFPDVSFCSLETALGTGETVSIEDGIEVPTVSGDDLVDTLGLKPTFLKIDVEGNEFRVLQSLARSIEAHKPSMLLEIHPEYLPDDTTPETVEQWLRERGYNMRKVDYTSHSWRQVWFSV